MHEQFTQIILMCLLSFNNVHIRITISNSAVEEWALGEADKAVRQFIFFALRDLTIQNDLQVLK